MNFPVTRAITHPRFGVYRPSKEPMEWLKKTIDGVAAEYPLQLKAIDYQIIHAINQKHYKQALILLAKQYIYYPTCEDPNAKNKDPEIATLEKALLKVDELFKENKFSDGEAALKQVIQTHPKLAAIKQELEQSKR